MPSSEGFHQVVGACANRSAKIQRGGCRETNSIARIAPFLMKPSESNDN